MTKNIEPKLKNVAEYLKLDNEAIFVIPEYQRAYSWGINNCDKLWQDINDFVASGNKDRYFFGTIIINCEENDKKLNLIDGQQRTISFLLLLKAMLLQINKAINTTAKDEESESLCRGLKERRRKIMGILYSAETEDFCDIPDFEQDKALCQKDILLKNKSINEMYKSELKIILQSVSYDEIEKNVYKIPYRQKDNKYTNFFRNFKYFYQKISELSNSELNSLAKSFMDACEVIEIKSWRVEQAITMFNSLNSDGLPLYDADIISAKLYAATVDKDQEKEFVQQWSDLLVQIEELKKAKIADIDSMLMQYMYYERAKNKDIITESGKVDVTTPGVRRYFTDINKKLLDSPIEFCNQMKVLAEAWKKVSEYPAAQVLYKFNENSKLFLASYFYRFKAANFPNDKIEIILESLLRLFAILELVDVGYSSSNFKTFLFAEEAKFVDSAFSEEAIKEDFDAHINKIWNKEILRAELYDCNRNNLVYLNEYLFAKEKGLDFNLNEKCDIEHIMPDSGKNIQEIRRDADIYDKDEFDDMVNKLGNKILLEEKINRSVGNEWFRTKVSTKLEDKTGYIDSEYPIACKLVECYKNDNKPFWKKNDITAATEKASERIINFIFG